MSHSFCSDEITIEFTIFFFNFQFDKWMDCKSLPEFNQSLRGMCHQDSRYTPKWKINSKKTWQTNVYDPRAFSTA